MNVEERLRQVGERQREVELPSQDEWHRFCSRAHGRLVRRKVGIVLATTAVAVAVVAGAQGVSSLLANDAALPAGIEDDEHSNDARPVDDAEANESRGGLTIMQTWYVQGDLLYLNHQIIESPASSLGNAPSRRAALMERALKRVLGGPAGPVAETTDPSVSTAFPRGIRLNGLDLDRRTTVDLSGFPSGSSANRLKLALAQVAATVLQYDDVDSVEIFQEGTPLTDAPLTEAFYERLLAPIVLTEPPYAEHPKSFVHGLGIEGTANVFEATVAFEVVDGDGDVISEGFTTATCGSGCRGDFSEWITFEVAQPTFATVNVYSPSAEDGSRLFEVSVPVYLCPGDGTGGGAERNDPYDTCGSQSD